MFVEFMILVTVFASVFWYMKYTVPKFGKKLPGPPILPFIGCALSVALSPKKRNYEIFEDICDKYGDVVGVLAGSQQFVAIRDYQIAKEIMVSDDFDARNRGAKFIMERSFDKNLGLIWSHGDSWKEIRRYSVRMMRNYGFGKGATMEVFLDAELRDFLRCFDLEKSKNNDIVNVFQSFNVSALNLTWSLVAGIRFSYEDKEFKEFIRAVDSMLKAIIPGVSSLNAFPWLRYIPHLTEHTELVRIHKELQLMFKEVVDIRKERGNYKENPLDFIDAFLKDIENQPIEKQDPNNLDNFFTEEQLIMVCLDLFFASADTTSSAIEFSLLFMLLNPQVLEKVRDEIETVIGTSRLPNLSDREHMPYIEATLQEVFRYSSVNPVAARSAKRDLLIDGYFVPQGAVIGILMHSFHMDEKIWGDPENFRPERFLDDNNRFIKSDKVWSFGLGKRSCIGEQLARATFFMFFTTLVQRYDITKIPQEELTKEPRTGITSTPQPFKMIAKSRKVSYDL